MVKIKNQNFCAEIETFGAQLVSLSSEKKEYIWQRDPRYWKSCATLLFPIIGGFKNDEYLVNKKTYQMTQHGLIRQSNLIITNQKENEVTLMLEANEKTLKQYPYKFRFEVIYKMLENGISTVMKVTNIDNKPIYFSIGGHPGFNIPLNENESFDDYYVEFEKEEDFSTTLITKKQMPILNNQRRFFLNESLFIDNALVFKNLQSKKISLKSINHSTIISVFTYNLVPYYGIWRPINAPLICLEPWDGHLNFGNINCDFSDRVGMHKIDINQNYLFGYDILIENSKTIKK